MRQQCEKCKVYFEDDRLMDLCPNCRLEDHEKFSLIRDYIYDHPGATISEVTQALHISHGSILKYLREGRIETVGSIKVLNCTSCGVPINYGTLCDTCKLNKSHDFTSAAKAKPSDSKKKMHTKLKK